MTNLVLTIMLELSATQPATPPFVSVSNNLPCRIFVARDMGGPWEPLTTMRKAGSFRYPTFFHTNLFFRAEAL